MILGTISAVDNSDGLQLIIDGEEVATTKKYSYIASYVPAAEDRVVVEEIGGSYVILGKIITDMASSGIARQAANAENAVTAETAASATISDTTKGFDSSVSSESGRLVTSFTREYNSTVGSFIVTDISTSHAAHNFVYK